MTKTIAFTTTDVIKRARKYIREHQDAWGIDEMSPEEADVFSREINQLTSTFFNLAKTTECPEQEFLGFTLRGSFATEEKPTKVACLVLHYAAKSLIEEKVKVLSSCLNDSQLKRYEALQWYRQYEAIRSSGAYNMITEAKDAAKAANLTMDQYKYVVNNYSSLQASAIVEDALAQPAPF